MAQSMVSSRAEPSGSKGGMLAKIKMVTGLQSSVPSSETGKGRSKTNRLSHGFCLVKGKANHPMEDYHHAEIRRLSNAELGLYGIFDGHLGHDVAHYLQQNLFENIIHHHEFSKNPTAAVRKAYVQTDKVILQKSPDLGFGGSTAVTAIVIDGKKLVIANVGDSRAVLCRSGDAIQLSVDHEPRTEKESIESRGGFVTVLPGDVPRVNGQLAVARAFGDKNLKGHLTSEPDFVDMQIGPEDEFLILASDGLWKVMENQDAVNCIRKIKDPESAAKALVSAALARKSKDDISCIVVRLR